MCIGLTLFSLIGREPIAAGPPGRCGSTQPAVAGRQREQRGQRPGQPEPREPEAEAAAEAGEDMSDGNAVIMLLSHFRTI